ncbi:gamma-butyrobetaine hydroxylase-like domain-containing protein [Bradyrhizobium sp. USDA 4508]
MQPTQIELCNDATILAVTWPDCGTRQVDAGALRRASRAASEIRRQIEDIELALPTDLHIAAIEPIGNYALRLHFSDGHDRGIYPWSYLRELAGQQSA